MTTKLYFVSSDPNPKKYVHDPRGKVGTGVFWQDRHEAETYRDALNLPYGKEVYSVFMWKGAPYKI